MSGKKMEKTAAEAGNQEQKERTIEEKMEAGKIEVQKLVEGVQGAERLTELIERGQ